MSKLAMTLSVASLLLAGGAHAQSNNFATGNMHFDAKDMDVNGDHMVSREEMQQYAEKLWQSMSEGKDTIPISVATKDFATKLASASMTSVSADESDATEAAAWSVKSPTNTESWQRRRFSRSVSSE